MLGAARAATWGCAMQAPSTAACATSTAQPAPTAQACPFVTQRPKAAASMPRLRPQQGLHPSASRRALPEDLHSPPVLLLVHHLLHPRGQGKVQVGRVGVKGTAAAGAGQAHAPAGPEGGWGCQWAGASLVQVARVWQCSGQLWPAVERSGRVGWVQAAAVCACAGAVLLQRVHHMHGSRRAGAWLGNVGGGVPRVCHVVVMQLDWLLLLQLLLRQAQLLTVWAWS